MGDKILAALIVIVLVACVIFMVTCGSSTKSETKTMKCTCVEEVK